MSNQETNAPLAEPLGRVVIVGGGRMGQAICAGLLRQAGLAPERITVANPGEAKRKAVSDAYGVKTVPSASEGLPADTVILAVKPAKVAQVARELASAGLGDALVVSIAAGVSTAAISGTLGSGRVVRVMPNTPLLCGAGVCGVSGGGAASSRDVELVCRLFSLMGTTVVVDEADMDAVTALSGSGPAYFELFAEAMARAGEELGLSYETALKLVLGTMGGTASMIQQTGQDLREAIDAVSSPGGTTVAALGEFERCGFEDAVAAGVKAAAARSKELGE